MKRILFMLVVAALMAIGYELMGMRGVALAALIAMLVGWGNGWQI